ncbi:TIGR02680 family protein [Kutzneria chonburiensis]|uniref:TIGR02680 family protein n=1 Tax=Kutzneria chonburiensis TaxID=1483604 RepID=UPI003081B6AD
MTITELPWRAAEPLEREAHRWVPTRAGILNVWRYYDEVFEFQRGRLLLRGENGSGKSKALELLLPYLFDANLRANRLSTFGTSERTMHWNLMGDGASGTTRVGYVWVEFRQGDTWFSCGARLQASNHTTAVHADYFTTTLRVGDGLELVTDSGTPLTRNALEQALGDHGLLHGNATEYRSAIRTTLFPGLSEQRYDALITALLQLRTPKLSQRLDPSLLSTLLSRALPPLDQQEIADLAEGFERLDRQRERLTALDAEVTAARTLGGRQRTYAQRVLRAAAATLISATTELDNLTKSARRSAEQHDQVAEQKAETEARIETLVVDEEETQARIAGLVESDAYQHGHELDQLRQHTSAAESRAVAARSDAEAKRRQAVKDAETAANAERDAELRAGTEAVRAADARQAAARAGLIGVHAEVTETLTTAAKQSRVLLRAAVQGRARQIALVRDALAEHATAVDRRQQAETDLEDARSDLSAAEESRAEAAERCEQALTRLVDDLRAWARDCRELAFPDLDMFDELVENEAALLEHVDAVAGSATDVLVRAESSTEAEQDAKKSERDGLADELDALGKKQDLPPEAPPTRTADRSTMAGAPLWRLVRFADSVPESTQASIEAALQSAGVLDAWVGADGAVTGHDVFAVAEAVPPAAGQSLSDVLIPERDAVVPASVVARLLAGVAYGDRAPAGHPAAVGADGSWRLGNLVGSWQKPHAAYIGAVARERARQRRMGELRAQIDQLDTELGALASRLQAIQARRSALARERAARPPYGDVRAARDSLTRKESDVESANRHVRKQLDTLSKRESAVSASLHELTVLAAEHGMPTDRAALDNVERAVEAFRDQAEIWLDSHDELMAARRQRDTAADWAARSGAVAGEREHDAAEAEENTAGSPRSWRPSNAPSASSTGRFSPSCATCAFGDPTWPRDWWPRGQRHPTSPSDSASWASGASPTSRPAMGRWWCGTTLRVASVTSPAGPCRPTAVSRISVDSPRRSQRPTVSERRSTPPARWRPRGRTCHTSRTISATRCTASPSPCTSAVRR